MRYEFECECGAEWIQDLLAAIVPMLSPIFEAREICHECGKCVKPHTYVDDE